MPYPSIVGYSYTQFSDYPDSVALPGYYQTYGPTDIDHDYGELALSLIWSDREMRPIAYDEVEDTWDLDERVTLAYESPAVEGIVFRLYWRWTDSTDNDGPFGYGLTTAWDYMDPETEVDPLQADIINIVVHDVDPDNPVGEILAQEGMTAPSVDVDVNIALEILAWNAQTYTGGDTGEIIWGPGLGYLPPEPLVKSFDVQAWGGDWPSGLGMYHMISTDGVNDGATGTKLATSLSGAWDTIAANIIINGLVLDPGIPEPETAQITRFSQCQSPEETIPFTTTDPLEVTFNIDSSNELVRRVYVGVYVEHNNVGDLVIELESPEGTIRTLVSNDGGTLDDFGAGDDAEAMTYFFDDAVNGTVTDWATPGSSPVLGEFEPVQSFATFIDENATGLWTLRFSDTVEAVDGVLHKTCIYVDTIDPDYSALPVDRQCKTGSTFVPALTTQEITFQIQGKNTLTTLDPARLALRVDSPDLSRLTIELESPLGTIVVLADGNASGHYQLGSSTADSDLAVFSDTGDAGNIVTWPSDPSIIEGGIIALNPFSAFAGEDPNGEWKLRITDSGEPVIPEGELTGHVITNGSLHTPLDVYTFSIYDVDVTTPNEFVEVVNDNLAYIQKSNADGDKYIALGLGSSSKMFIGTAAGLVEIVDFEDELPGNAGISGAIFTNDGTEILTMVYLPSTSDCKLYRCDIDGSNLVDIGDLETGVLSNEHGYPIGHTTDDCMLWLDYDNEHVWKTTMSNVTTELLAGEEVGNESLWAAQLSPDGTKLVICEKDESIIDVYPISGSTLGSPTRLTPSGKFDWLYSGSGQWWWSPDSSMILIQRTDDDYSDSRLITITSAGSIVGNISAQVYNNWTWAYPSGAYVVADIGPDGVFMTDDIDMVALPADLSEQFILIDYENDFDFLAPNDLTFNFGQMVWLGG